MYIYWEELAVSIATIGEGRDQFIPKNSGNSMKEGRVEAIKDLNW